MKFLYTILIASLFITLLTAQTQGDNRIYQSPEDKYLERWLGQTREDSNFEMEFRVDGSASLHFGLNFSDRHDPVQTQGFLTVIDSSLDLDFTFYPDTYGNIYSSNRRFQGIYTEIELSDFDIIISNDAGIDFWENYRVYDNYGNPYLPDQTNDDGVISNDNPGEEDAVYENTMLYTGVTVTPPTVRALLHLTPHLAFQIASQPDIEFNMSDTLDGDEWAGVSTENSGGFSLVMDYPLMNLTASAVSQHYYDYEDPNDSSFRQDDEFGCSLEFQYFFGEMLRYESYFSFVNYFSRDNRDSFYFATERGESIVDSVISGGMALRYAPLELVELGFSGDINFITHGIFDRNDYTGNRDTYYGLIYDVRIDAPLYYTPQSALVISAGANDYTFRDLIFTDDEKNREFPLDVQLSYLYQNEIWEFQTVLLASNFLNYIIEYEDVLLGDYQNLSAGIESSIILGDPMGFFISPGLSLGYSLGRITTNGYIWDGNGSKTYVDNWQDNVFGGEVFLQIGFPQTLVTMGYENLQLLPNQYHVLYSERLRTQDMGTFTMTMEIFY